MCIYRLLFTGSRNGQFPMFLSLISTTRSTPAPALVFLATLSLCYLSTSDIIQLIEYSSFVESSFIMLTVAGMIYLRYKKPHLHRPIKVHIAIPITFLLLCAFLVFLPVYVRPFECGMAVLITLTGVPFYVIFIHAKPECIKRLTHRITETSQKIFLSLPEDDEQEAPAKEALVNHNHSEKS